MNMTSRLSLPLIAPSQAQKHVTHNEALLAIDIVVALHLEAVAALEPPQDPAAGACYGVGENAIGAWSGKDGSVAVFDDGYWRFAVPARGWQATIGQDAVPHVHDGSGWRLAIDAVFSNLPGIGIGGAPDSENAVVMRVENVLLDSPVASDGVALKINRTGVNDDAAVLFQTGYSGRAELRLDEDDGFAIKISGDGAEWKTCLAADPASAAISLPGGLDARSGSVDLLLNGRFELNQRGTAEGTVAAGAFVCDRWRAGADGVDWQETAGGLRMLSGSLVQIVEPGFFGEQLTAGTRVRCTAEGLSEGALTVSLGSQQVTLSSQGPRAEIVLSVSVADAIELHLSPDPAGPATLEAIRLHCVRPWLGEAIRSPDEDARLCRRYFYKSHASEIPVDQPSGAAPGTVATELGLYYAHVSLPLAMAHLPAATLCNPSTGLPGSWITGGGTSVTPVADVSDSGLTVYGSGAEAGTLVYGHFYLDAEPDPAPA